MKRIAKPSTLRLSLTTVRALRADELPHAVGGLRPTHVFVCSVADNCLPPTPSRDICV